MPQCVYPFLCIIVYWAKNVAVNHLYQSQTITMNNSKQQKISQFWDKYINFTITYNIPEDIRRWYVKRVEDYIRSHKNLHLANHSAEHVTNYLKG